MLLSTVLGADWVIHRRKPRWIVIGLFDEPAHLATAALISTRPAFLAGAVLPDLDHIPLALRPVHPGPGEERPRSHTLALSAALAVVDPATAAGTLVHFARDLVGDSGVPLLWPLSDRRFRVPHPVYAAGVVWLAWRAAGTPTSAAMG